MKIDIIGKGNVGTHLWRAFQPECDCVCVSSRDLAGLRKDSDIYIICVSDNVIAEIAEKVASEADKNSVIAHTSGSTPLSALQNIAQHKGVFYPLQTFSKNVELDYSEIPLFIEGDNDRTENILKKCGQMISDRVLTADSGTRCNLHVASVFGCNFVNHLWTLADNYLNSKGLNFDLLMPLIKETTRKIQRTTPRKAQTGPASRNDTVTIGKHLEQLSIFPEMQEIYRILSESIVRNSDNQSIK